MPPTRPSNRRSFLQQSAVALAVLGAASSNAAQSDPVSNSQAAADAPTAAAAALKPLSFNPARLNGLSERLLLSHWKNNYGGSVRALAVVQSRLADALASSDTPAYIYNDLKREHLIRTGSVIYHEYYFDNLGGNGSASAGERSTLARAFGSYDNWEKEFRRIGAGLGGGSGWVVLGWNYHTQQLENYWLADHAHGPAATLPILVMDMYEHSYHMDYGPATARYIDAFMANVQWETVAQRLESVRALS